ncbi:hydroxymethylpyrimidine/phosphomethylpyrimidine kinase [Radicibacter daui]|uniref:hydroxymethylpyrimidine/phosphomethylpyrimidine kinase n=1 Tax=Radicibacter daui TaxID=3064829 RepID=UPI004046C2BF
MTRPVLLVGGMDSSGGAGLLRDTATLAGIGVPARVAVTAVTAQTDHAVTASHPVPPEVVAAQIAAAGPNLGAIKIGMLATVGIVQAVAAALPSAPLVLDPVLRSSSGADLLDSAGTVLLVERLLPRVSLLTPNLLELQVLAGLLGVAEGEASEHIARALLAQGCGAVLVKGGHDTEDTRLSADTLYRRDDEPVTFASPRYPGTLRGTGCQLASGIAGCLALGHPLVEAIRRAKGLVDARFAAAAVVED